MGRHQNKAWSSLPSTPWGHRSHTLPSTSTLYTLQEWWPEHLKIPLKLWPVWTEVSCCVQYYPFVDGLWGAWVKVPGKGQYEGLRELREAPIYQMLQANFSVLSTRAAIVVCTGECRPDTVIFISRAGERVGRLRNWTWFHRGCWNYWTGPRFKPVSPFTDLWTARLMMGKLEKLLFIDTSKLQCELNLPSTNFPLCWLYSWAAVPRDANPKGKEVFFSSTSNNPRLHSQWPSETHIPILNQSFLDQLSPGHVAKPNLMNWEWRGTWLPRGKLGCCKQKMGHKLMGRQAQQRHTTLPSGV